MRHTIKSSVYRGVCWSPNLNRWRAYVMPNRKQEHLGLFEDEEEAARAYDAAARRIWGNKARTNFQLVEEPIRDDADVRLEVCKIRVMLGDLVDKVDRLYESLRIS